MEEEEEEKDVARYHQNRNHPLAPNKRGHQVWWGVTDNYIELRNTQEMAVKQCRSDRT